MSGAAVGAKPCPWCGGDGRLVESGGEQPYSVECEDCECDAARAATPEAAWANWDRRPGEDAAYRAGRDAVVAWLRAEADVHAVTAKNAFTAGSSSMAHAHSERANLLSLYAEQVSCIKPPAAQEDPSGKAGR